MIDSPAANEAFNDTLDPAIRSRILSDINGLQMHVLEAGDSSKPLILLLHGFPELAYSWRKVIPGLAALGFYVVAPDQRGYGKTLGADNRYDGDVDSFRQFNLVRDVLGLLSVLGRRQVHLLVGHDFGSPVAASCALLRPDIFRALAMMSAPFAGMPPITDGQAQNGDTSVASIDHAALAALDVPRQHYQWYYSERPANDNMLHCEQGVHDFMRAYYHCKSADWEDNKPHRLEDWSATSLGRLPEYYVMRADTGMAQTVAAQMPTQEDIARCEWLTADELSVYAMEFQRTGFQGGLNWYRCVTSGAHIPEMQLFGGAKITVPSLFVAGKSDWGIYQKPGEFERMQDSACADFKGVKIIPGAGHWVQQEQPDAVLAALATVL